MLIRFNIRGAIPPPSTQAEKNWLDDFKTRCRLLKSRCVVINDGKPNQENITNFTYHECHHDEGLPCEGESEI